MEIIALLLGAALIGTAVVAFVSRTRKPRVHDVPRGAQIPSGAAKIDTFEELARQAESSGVRGDITPDGWRPASVQPPQRRARRESAATPWTEPKLPAGNIIMQLTQAFSPAAPVNRQDLFAGRHQQMERLIDVAFERGQHAVIYGERGVGKTSLATVMTLVLGARGTKLATKVNCDATDSYDSIWRKVIEEIQIVQRLTRADFAEEVPQGIDQAVEELQSIEQVKPADVRRMLRMITSATEAVIFVDEFERLTDRSVTTLFADTMKMLSDQQIPATVVIVGVADNIEELIKEHRSIERALVQIHMPRMSEEELVEIVRRGLGTVDMKITDEAAFQVAALSRGLPHFTHLIAQSAARSALGAEDVEVGREHVLDGIKRLVERAQETLVEAYEVATASHRQTIYPQVLLAAALSSTDSHGFFAPTDLVQPLTMITGHDYQIPSFSRHLHALSEPQRGPALLKRGSEHRYRFRFQNPLLQPFVLMRAVATDMVSLDDVLKQVAVETGP